MGEAATVASLNAWGAARDSELIQLRLVVAAHAGELGQLRGDVGLTQTVVASAPSSPMGRWSSYAAAASGAAASGSRTVKGWVCVDGGG